MSTTYTGRHRPPTRAERRELERRTRLPRLLGPGYAVPTAAAATLVLTAAGATVPVSSAFGSVSPSEAAGQAMTFASGQDAASEETAATPETAEAARSEFAEQTADATALSERRQASATSVAQDQGRQQERERVARDKKRKELAEKKAREEAAAKAAAEADAQGTSTGSTEQAAAASTGDAATSGDSAEVGSQSWVRPVDGATFTSPFGPRWGRLHAGQDYAAPIGTPLKSMSSGEIIFAGSMDGYGTTVDIRYWDGTVSRYGHMNSIAVSVGQQVGPGTVVGESGNTGRSTGPHLHVEVHPGGGSPVDPAPWMAERGIAS